ncbi:glycosyl hydrolase [Candidatus Dependentiae bacterium]|nr:glycosyl hydrolase [Candidatus Dependentiae bacterium]
MLIKTDKVLLSLLISIVTCYGGGVVPVGAGGYTTVLPAGQKGPSNRLGNPVTPKVTASFNQVPITHKDWSSLIWQWEPTNPYSENIFLHPLAFRARANGLGVCYPNWNSVTPITSTAPKGHSLQEYHFEYIQDMVVGVVGLNSPDTRVDSYTDWTVTAFWSGNARTLKATIGHGLPFAYFEISGDAALITGAAVPTVWSNANGVLGITISGKHYGVFAPAGSTWTVSGTNLQSSLAGKNYFSIAVLPDNTATTLEYYRQHAYAFVTDTKVSWNYDQNSSNVTTNFNVNTVLKESGNGNVNQPLLALYRHQWLNTTATLTNYTYISPRGQMKVLDGSSFSTILQYNGVLPEIPLVAKDGENTFSLSQLYGYVDAIYKQTPTARWNNIAPGSGDTYWFGKAAGRVARLVHIADQVNHTAARDLFIQEIKNRLQEWLDGVGSTLYYYNNTWKTLIGYPASYGSDTDLNDHHFHWGYAIIAASTVAQFDPAWASSSQWGGMLELLAKDVNNWDRTDTRFPFLRYLDCYAGHSYANGSSLFGAGNNEESSSEAMNCAIGMILLGEATGNNALRDLGIYYYTTEISAIEQYWFDIDNIVFPTNFAKPVVGMVWSNGGAYAIWWDGYVEELHGINFLPITGGSVYLGRNPDYLKINQDFMNSNHGGNDSWRDIHMEVQALYDPAGAINKFNTIPYTIEAGESKAHTYYWIHNLNVLGRLNKTVTANVPSYNVFTNNNVKTYVAHNFGTNPITVQFSDGAKLNVPARATATGNGTDVIITPTITPPPPAPNPDKPLDFVIDFVAIDSGKLDVSFAPLWSTTNVDLTYVYTTGEKHRVDLINNNNVWQTEISGLNDGQIVKVYFTYEKGGQVLTTGWMQVRYELPCSQCICLPCEPCTPTSDGPYQQNVTTISPNKIRINFIPNIAAKFVEVYYSVNGQGTTSHSMVNTNGTWSYPVYARTGDDVKYLFFYELIDGTIAYTTWFDYLRQ